ncbi:MAG: DNA/RNA non-specific endonuclease [Verrucomicrobia bacterium]|nr:DNA/RNA non-specific endonuclease [Verrucomicrobiota bacterium]
MKAKKRVEYAGCVSWGRRTVLSIATAIVFSLGAGSADAIINASLQMQTGNPSGATANSSDHNHYLVQRTVQALDFSDALGVPRWASWDLTSGDIGSSGRSSSFYVDSTLPSTFYRVKTGDYTGSGYDRGHMTPSLDRTDTDANNKLVFYMSNILPQTPDNNQGPWLRFEEYCQSLAQAGNELLLMSGGSGFSGAYIPSGKAAIPGNVWKIALVVPSGSGSALSRITAATRVIAVSVPNVSGIRSVPWTDYLTSASRIETDTGYSFFSAVSADIAAVLRARVDGVAAPEIASLSPSSGAVGSTVEINGANLAGASVVRVNGKSAAFTVNSATKITATIPASATSGKISVIAPGGLATSAGSFTVTVAPPSGGGGTGDKVVISQVYGGGGNSGATYKNDFIEIYNAGTTTVSLSSYAVQYAASGGTSWKAAPLSGTLAPGKYYLIQGAGGSTGKALPTPQATSTINMAAGAGKVALTKTQTALTGSNPVGNTNVVDFVGYGSANAYEGSGAAPTISATKSAMRAGNGATDTNNNAFDFSATTPNPRNK